MRTLAAGAGSILVLLWFVATPIGQAPTPALRHVVTTDDSTGAVTATWSGTATTEQPLESQPGHTHRPVPNPSHVYAGMRWDGKAFVKAPAPTPTRPTPLATTLTDRQLLEVIARALGVAR